MLLRMVGMLRAKVGIFLLDSLSTVLLPQWAEGRLRVGCVPTTAAVIAAPTPLFSKFWIQDGSRKVHILKRMMKA